MQDTHFDLVVIGAGPGGYAAAFMAADLGVNTALIDISAMPGGVCLNRGCIPSKALLHAAKVITEATEAEQWGIKYAKPEIDLSALRKQKENVVGKLGKGVLTLAAARKVTYVQGRATFESATTLLLDNQVETKRINFKYAIIAAGSRPAIPASLDVKDPRVMDSTEALNLPDVPKSLLVVGGGYIGMEMGTVYAALGSAVTVIEGTDRLLGGADPDLVRPVAARAKKAFREIRYSTQVEKLTPQKDGISVSVKSEKGPETLLFDRVLISVGRRPNSETLGLKNTKIVVANRGFIQVDKQMRTAEPNIFAIGDIIGEPMLAHKATYEGRVAAQVVAGKDVVMDAKAIPAVVFTDPEVAWAGLTEEGAKAAGKEVSIAKFPWGASGRATTLARNDGLTKFILEPDTGRILGVGICGSGAGELIAEGVLAIEMGAVAEDVAQSIHPHPTLSETLMEGADVFFGHATHIYAPKR